MSLKRSQRTIAIFENERSSCSSSYFLLATTRYVEIKRKYSAQYLARYLAYSRRWEWKFLRKSLDEYSNLYCSLSIWCFRTPSLMESNTKEIIFRFLTFDSFRPSPYANPLWNSPPFKEGSLQSLVQSLYNLLKPACELFAFRTPQDSRSVYELSA